MTTVKGIPIKITYLEPERKSEPVPINLIVEEPERRKEPVKVNIIRS